MYVCIILLYFPSTGAFIEAFRCLFEQFTGSPLNVHFCGKPFEIQYNLAEDMIAKDAIRLGLNSKPTRFIGIGTVNRIDSTGHSCTYMHSSYDLVFVYNVYLYQNIQSSFIARAKILHVKLCLIPPIFSVSKY